MHMPCQAKGSKCSLIILRGMQERLFQKAERLAPGQYAEKVQAVERRKKAHEAQMAAKVDPHTFVC